jgi:hypothetical protein
MGWLMYSTFSVIFPLQMSLLDEDVDIIYSGRYFFFEKPGLGIQLRYYPIYRNNLYRSASGAKLFGDQRVALGLW